MGFNFIEFFDDHNIPYQITGKGWIETKCIFCDDPSFHLGCNLKYGGIHCWRCSSHTLWEFVMEIVQGDENEARKISKKYSTKNIEEEIFLEEKSTDEQIITIPNEAMILPDRHKKYLFDRGFLSPNKIIEEWLVMGTEGIGEYKWRIIIPILHEGKLVSFQGRDITGKQKDKYKTCYGTNIKNYLYGLDYVKRDSVIIVEGVTGVWRLGKGNAIATFGIEYTDKQLILLVKKKFKKIGVLFDNELQAQKKAKELVENLKCFNIEAINLTCPEGKDSGELTQEEVKKYLSFFSCNLKNNFI